MSDWFNNINSTLGKVDSITGKISDAIQNKDGAKAERLRMESKANASGVPTASMFKNKTLILLVAGAIALLGIFFIFKKR